MTRPHKALKVQAAQTPVCGMDAICCTLPKSLALTQPMQALRRLLAG